MDSSNASIEMLRPKTVPENLIAWATVLHVSEYQVKLQITGGIVCLVDRLNVSQSYTELIQSSDKAHGLGVMFRRGQQYVVKILDKQARKGYASAQDIIASLDPSCIQEDNLASTLLAIPNVPIQGSIRSIEDHGYQVDIGFKGLTGFLKYEDAEEYCAENLGKKKFLLGQIVRCYLKKVVEPSEESRVVQLTMSEQSSKDSEFSEKKVSQFPLTERCVLPGSKSFLTILTVKKNGLIVNFMNEFSGFVSMDHLKEEWHNPVENYKISQQFKCRVLYYNELTKTFALSIVSDKKYKKTLEHFIRDYHIGQMIKNAELAYIKGTKSVIFKVNGDKAIANVMDAINEEVATMTKDELHLSLDSAFPESSKHKCRIKSINLVDLILVVSLRNEFMNLPCVSVEELRPGDFIDATVKKIVRDGVVVTFGLNLKAIILDAHLNDSKTTKIYPIGKTIKCRVLKLDSSKQPVRVFLTNKDKFMDSHITLIDSYDKSFKGESTYAIINKVSPKGLIVELFNNVKGFIPKIFLSLEGVQATSIGRLFDVGQIISCVVYRVDPIRPSLMLGIIPLSQILKMKRDKKKFKKLKKEAKKLGIKPGEFFKLKRKQDDDKKNANDEDQSCIEIDNNDETDNDDDDDDDDDTESNDKQEENSNKLTCKLDENQIKTIKSRRQRSEEAKLREEKLREAERLLMDPSRPPQSIPDFERLVLKTPNNSDVWIKYSKFFLDNVETEKARIICRRALRTLDFRSEKEKLKIWLHLIHIEVKFGGAEQMRATIEEALQTNDKIKLYQGAAHLLSKCNEFDEADKIYESLLKIGRKFPEVWIDYLNYLMEYRKNPEQARIAFETSRKHLFKSDLVNLQSKFAQMEFKFGDVERAKTIFENLLSNNPKRTDLWKVYEAMIRKYGLRQIDTEEAKEQKEEILERILDNINLVSKKTIRQNKKKLKTC